MFAGGDCFVRAFEMKRRHSRVSAKPCFAGGKCREIRGQVLVDTMISDILGACREVLEINGDSQSAYWLASQMVEMRMWRTNEHDVRAALEKDIGKLGARSLFVKVADDEYALRAWTNT